MWNFQFQSQKKLLLIRCPITKPKNDNFLPSNSRDISNNFLNSRGSVCTKNLWNLDPLILELVKIAILLFIMSVTWTVYARWYIKETLRIASKQCLCTGLERGQIIYVLFSDYSLVKEQWFLSCAMRQWDGLNMVKLVNQTCRCIGVIVSADCSTARLFEPML